MKVAVPVLRNRVSPAFDWCRHLTLIDVGADGTPAAREQVSITEVQPYRRPDRLTELGVDVLLCGGISPPLAQLVESHGVRVVPGVAGEVDTVVTEFLAGRLPDPRFMMPGRRCRGGGRRRRRGRPW